VDFATIAVNFAPGWGEMPGIVGEICGGFPALAGRSGNLAGRDPVLGKIAGNLPESLGYIFAGATDILKISVVISTRSGAILAIPVEPEKIAQNILATRARRILVSGHYCSG
jgi:hypothetical protein